jgi:hypothetical protein
MEEAPIENFENLKAELVNASHDTDENTVEVPKKSTKQFLIDKILDFSADGQDVPSHSKLKRMSKKALSEILATCIEEKMRRKMCESVNAPMNSDNKTLLLSSLRMVHDLVANVCESGANMVLEPRGYSLENFSANLKGPVASECVDQCLMEICQEHAEILEYIESPFTRLSLCWISCAAQNIRTIQPKENVAGLGPLPLRRSAAMGAGPHRRPKNRKEFYASAPREPVQKIV